MTIELRLNKRVNALAFMIQSKAIKGTFFQKVSHPTHLTGWGCHTERMTIEIQHAKSMLKSVAIYKRNSFVIRNSFSNTFCILIELLRAKEAIYSNKNLAFMRNAC